MGCVRDSESGLVRTTAPNANPQSSRADDFPPCRFCLERESLSKRGGELISPCACSGTQARVHVKCLLRWQATCRDGGGRARCVITCFERRSGRCLRRFSICVWRAPRRATRDSVRGADRAIMRRPRQERLPRERASGQRPGDARRGGGCVCDGRHRLRKTTRGFRKWICGITYARVSPRWRLE